MGSVSSNELGILAMGRNWIGQGADCSGICWCNFVDPIVFIDSNFSCLGSNIDNVYAIFNVYVIYCFRSSNYPPPIFPVLAGLTVVFQARVAAMMSKVAAPLSLAVSTVVLTSASACAAHMAR